jgi:S1/P1 Nuclease
VDWLSSLTHWADFHDDNPLDWPIDSRGMLGDAASGPRHNPSVGMGQTGHRVISRLAKKHMTETARDALAELLEPNETIADASTWADENRRRLPKTAPWHYMDVPLDELAYDANWSADDPNKGFYL